MRIKKLKYKPKDNEVEAIYEQEGPNGWDKYALTSGDSPRPEMQKALNALAEDVVKLCEIPNKGSEDVAVTGVTFSYGGDKEVMGACIIAQIRLKNSYQPLNVITPHKASESYSDYEDPMQILDFETVNRLKNVIEEALRYVNGDRAQQNLFAGEKAA
jgi:hypothetical protein